MLNEVGHREREGDMSLGLEPPRPLATLMSPGAVLYSGAAGIRVTPAWPAGQVPAAF